MKIYVLFLRGSFAAALVIAVITGFVPFAAAQTAAPKLSKSQAGFYRMNVGDFEVIALSDGTVSLPVFDLLTNIRPLEIQKLLADAFVKAPLDASVNAFLIKPSGNTNKLIMVDAGSGELYGPTLNKLVASLKAIGYEPEQITDILLTHIHTDHSGGLMDGTRMVFPNAVVHTDKREAGYWLNSANADKAEANKKQLFREAAAKVKPYLDAGKVKTFDGDSELFPGIRSVATPGHTPGHSFYSVESKGEKIVFFGDIMHVAEVQFPNPSVTIMFDSDSKAAAAQRKKAFADAAKNGYWIAPAHVSFPGIGHLRADGSGYKWIPIAYVNDAYEIDK